MSEILDMLVACERVTEWVNPWDERLVAATGEPAPQHGGAGRIGWFEVQEDWPSLATNVKRILVPKIIAAKVTAEVVGAEDWSTVVIDVPSPEDWSTCFPVNERTQVFNRSSKRVWAAVGLCSNMLGLAVFAKEQENNAIEARVQLISEEVFEKIF